MTDDRTPPAPITPIDPLGATPWTAWRDATPARIALGRVGAGLPTHELLRFGVAHAMARDAIHAEWDIETLTHQISALGLGVVQTVSRAGDRSTYLRRPDLGRQLADGEAAKLRAMAVDHDAPVDLALVVGDGLSSLAIERNAVPLLRHLLARLPAGTHVGPVVLVRQARVAVADEVGEALGARQAVILIGERPGLSSPDSMGLYLTHAPQRGRTDAQRNCISNVRQGGLSHEAAATKLVWLLAQAHLLGQSGVALKDESDGALHAPALPSQQRQQNLS
jgi:ethanolamine ammonia-lyase small subunit